MAQQAGFRLLFAPKARIWHSVSASTRRDIGVRRYHMVKSTLLFLKKHTSESSFALVLLFWSLVYMRFLLIDLVHGQVSALRYYCFGLQHGLCQIMKTQSDLVPCIQDVTGENNVTAFTPD
jgi:GT2 family glycosyltransferase